MAGKGSRPRPYSISQNQFASNWDNIFNKGKTLKRLLNLLPVIILKNTNIYLYENFDN